MASLTSTLRSVTIERLDELADTLDASASLDPAIAAIDNEVKAAYNDAREHAISAFLSILAGGCSEHVVMWNYTKLRDYLGEKVGIPTSPETT
jgi:hypothetical protein